MNMFAPDLKELISHLQRETASILKDNLIGFYLHGSLVLGGFNPNSSDIDIVVVTSSPMTVKTKRELARFFLKCSNSPFPIEISFLHNDQLKQWRHPCPFDFHYSEFWRERYENDLVNGTAHFLNSDVLTDADLAAHITILHHKGICIKGRPITEVFPLIPRSNYLSAIIGDFEDCLENIEKDPVYCTLNLIRVYWYVKEGVISSKQEAGNWGISIFPKELSCTIKKAMECYTAENDLHSFEKAELSLVRNYMSDKVHKLLTTAIQ